MTIVQEIKQAMRFGGTTMFFIGLMSIAKEEPIKIRRAIDAAGQELEQEGVVWAESVAKINADHAALDYIRSKVRKRD